MKSLGNSLKLHFRMLGFYRRKKSLQAEQVIASSKEASWKRQDVKVEWNVIGQKRDKTETFMEPLLNTRLFDSNFIHIISLILLSRHLYPCLYMRILRTGEVKQFAQVYTTSEMLLSHGQDDWLCIPGSVKFESQLLTDWLPFISLCFHCFICKPGT